MCFSLSFWLFLFCCRCRRCCDFCCCCVDPPTRCRQRRRCQVQGLFDGLIREWAQGAFEGVQQRKRNGEEHGGMFVGKETWAVKTDEKRSLVVWFLRRAFRRRYMRYVSSQEVFFGGMNFAMLPS